MNKAWKRCMEKAEITQRFTPHGMRYTFTDIMREADVDPVVRRALTGHVTKKMQHHYSTVRLDEKRSAIEALHRRVSIPGVKIRRAMATKSAENVQSQPISRKESGVVPETRK